MLSIFSCAYWPSVYLLWRNVYSGLLPIFPLIDWLFLLLSCISCLYILEIKPLSVASFEIIFSHSVSCISCLYILEIKPLSVASFEMIFSHSVSSLFCFLFGFLCCAKAFQFDEFPWVYFSFYFCCFGRLT